MCNYCNGQIEICPNCGGGDYKSPEKVQIRSKTYLIPLFVEQIEKEIKILDGWVNETKTGGWSTQNLEQMQKQSKDLKNFLYDLGY